MNQNLRNLRYKAGYGFASSLVVLAGALASHATFAQQEKESDDATVVEEVIVSGTRINLQNAQDIKREADTVVDAISAADIGTLPDRSVLEAIQRLPGVSVERFAGPDDPDHFSVEGSGALIRGMTQTRSEFNGRDSFTANSGRGLSFQDVSPELMGGVDVYKNQTADMVEGGIGGTISLRTRKPFDQDGRQVAFNIDYSYGDIAEEWSPTYSGLFSDRWDTGIGEFGFLVSFADSQLYGESHGIQSVRYSRYYAQYLADPEDSSIPVYDSKYPAYTDYFDDGIIPGAQDLVAAAPEGEPAVVWMPNSANALKKFDDRKRQGVATSAQWTNPSDTLQVTAEYIRSDANLTWYEKAIKYQGGNPDNMVNIRATAQGDSEIEFDDAGMFQSGTLRYLQWFAQNNNSDHVPSTGTSSIAGNGFGPRYQFETRIQDTSSLVEDYSINIEWRPTENLELIGDFQVVKAETEQDDLGVHLGAFAGQTYDITGTTPTLTLSDPWFGYRDENREQFYRGYPGFSDDPAGDSNYLQDPNNYFWGSAMDHYDRSEGDSVAARLDATYFFDGGFVKSIKAGVRFADREQVVRSSGYGWGAVGPLWDSGRPGGWVMDDRYAEQREFLEYVDWSDFHGGGVVEVEGGGKTLFASNDFVRSLMGANPSRDLITSGGSSATWEHSSIPRRIDEYGNPTVDSRYGLFEAGEMSYTREQNKAAYIRIDFGSEGDLRYSGNIGLRYVKLTRESEGYVVFPDYSPDTQVPAGVSLPLNFETVRSYLEERVESGYYATLEEAVVANDWVDDRNNYLSDELRGYANGAANAAPLDKNPEFDMFLPSFNIKFELTEDLIGRFALAKAAALPDIGEVRSRTNVSAYNYSLQTQTVSVEDLEEAGIISVHQNDGQDMIWLDTDGDGVEEEVSAQDHPYVGLPESSRVPGWIGSGGNPELAPMESIQYDIALEWYFSDVGQLSGTLFHKNLSNYFIKGSNYRQITNESTGVSQIVDVGSTINGAKAKMDGFELSYQQFFWGMFDGFGVQATYTYVDASGVPNNQIDYADEVEQLNSDDDPDNDVNADVLRVSLDNVPLQGQSKDTANLVGMYEKYGWNIRLAYNWRSKYLLTTRDVISKVPLYYDDHGQLDGSVFYNINDNFTVGLQATNLTDSQSKTIMVLNDEELEAGRSWFVSDRRVAFVVKGKF